MNSAIFSLMGQIYEPIARAAVRQMKRDLYLLELQKLFVMPSKMVFLGIEIPTVYETYYPRVVIERPLPSLLLTGLFASGQGSNTLVEDLDLSSDAKVTNFSGNVVGMHDTTVPTSPYLITSPRISILSVQLVTTDGTRLTISSMVTGLPILAPQMVQPGCQMLSGKSTIP